MHRDTGRSGMTAIEVLSSTMLAALLMTALMGVLRGLGMQQKALQQAAPAEGWQRSLDAALAADLAAAQTLQSSPHALTLKGYGGAQADGTPNWLPTTIVYEVHEHNDSYWLVRRELPTLGGDQPHAANLALAGVTEIRTGTAVAGQEAAHETAHPTSAIAVSSTAEEQPVTGGLVIEFWGEDRRAPLYSFIHQ